MNLHNGRNPSSRHAPDVAVGVGGGGVAAVVLDDDPAGVLGHEEVRLARRHRSPGRGRHGGVHVEWVERSQWYTFSLSASILSVGGSLLSSPGRQQQGKKNHSQVVDG